MSKSRLISKDHNNNIIIVDAGQRELTGTAKIQYYKQPDEVIWHRVVVNDTAGNWERATVVPGPLVQSEGEIVSPTLTPGQIYDVRIYREDRDPNENDVRPIARIRIYCLLKTEKRNFISEVGQNVGGTYIRAGVQTNQKTYTQLVVTDDTVTKDAYGFPSFNTVIGIVEDVNFQTSHTLELDTIGPVEDVPTLLPGNLYIAFVIASDIYGNWDVHEIIFKTLKRKITIRFKELIIDNDGDAGGTGEGSFYFTIIEGVNTVRRIEYENNNIDDRLAHRKIPLTFVHVLGPEKIDSPLNLTVSMDVNGLENDDFLDVISREQASIPPGNPEGYFYLPIGYQVEELIDQQKVIITKPVFSGDAFRFTVNLVYSVEYII